jgi:hypothetical protein
MVGGKERFMTFRATWVSDLVHKVAWEPAVPHSAKVKCHVPLERRLPSFILADEYI